MMLMADDEKCLDCEEKIAEDRLDPDYEGHGGSPNEPYFEGYHICGKDVPRVVKAGAT